MIDIDILRRKRGSGNGGGSGGEIYSGRSADYASEAGRAKAADRADSAATADEAAHAASAKELDGNSSVWQKLRDFFDGLAGKFLRKDQDDATPFKLTLGAAEVEGDASIKGDTIVGKDGFAGGLTGFGIKLGKNGMMEADGLSLRRFLEVPELRYNRVEVSCGDFWKCQNCDTTAWRCTWATSGALRAPASSRA